MQCSHETGRAFAVMFFGVASSYRVFLDLFDEQDGLRSLYNSISVLKILQIDDEASLMTDDEEATQKQVNISISTLFKFLFKIQPVFGRFTILSHHTKMLVDKHSLT